MMILFVHQKIVLAQIPILVPAELSSITFGSWCGFVGSVVSSSRGRFESEGTNVGSQQETF